MVSLGISFSNINNRLLFIMQVTGADDDTNVDVDVDAKLKLEKISEINSILIEIKNLNSEMNSISIDSRRNIFKNKFDFN